ncbi:hypothetical protein [Streptomyces lucensis]|nr:hypothetical protein [Streptomyces lucensis]
MTEHGGDAGAVSRTPRSRLYDYVDAPRPDQRAASGPEAAASPTAERARSDFAALLGEFRRTAVLVPLDADEEGLLTGDFGGVRWIYAFSGEQALARFALARGEGDREWTYQRWLGARLLDAGVPAVGVPCGVALDVGSEGEGVVFPPVHGVVPDAVAVDAETETGDVK